MNLSDSNLTKKNEVSVKEAAPFKLTLEQINEAKSLSSDPEFIEEVKESNFFSNLAKKFKVLGQVAALASVFAAFGPTSAEANEMKTAKVELREADLDKIKSMYKVPDTLRDLAQYEDLTDWYVRTCDQITYLTNHTKDMLSEEKDDFYKNVFKITTPANIAAVNSGEGRMYEIDEYAKYMKKVNSVYNEVSTRVESGITITDTPDSEFER